MSNHSITIGNTPYQQGRAYFRSGMPMNRSNDCPHQKGTDQLRIRWMSGFFDAYFQDWCDRHNAGKWGA